MSAKTSLKGSNTTWSDNPSTVHETSQSLKGLKRCVNARACISGPPTPGDSCIVSGRSSTTQSTRRLAVTAIVGITLYADGSVEVSDNGRGIPIDIEPPTGLSGVKLSLQTPCRRQTSSDSYAAAACTVTPRSSILSSRLDVQVTRGGKISTVSNVANQDSSSIRKTQRR